jgi:hypothetical protein
MRVLAAVFAWCLVAIIGLGAGFRMLVLSGSPPPSNNEIALWLGVMLGAVFAAVVLSPSDWFERLLARFQLAGVLVFAVVATPWLIQVALVSWKVLTRPAPVGLADESDRALSLMFRACVPSMKATCVGDEESCIEQLRDEFDGMASNHAAWLQALGCDPNTTWRASGAFAPPPSAPDGFGFVPDPP